ncbi:Rpn family recombination-promoting nuclease/putative transposase [Roseofilum capinflatum]|uniref:Rpn family recombination-promoting nuclease/putative transposase n=1 Tax=Roseofilum capinflatum BLCC-M114 TaxID=3022440 RepID=A0ABT7B9X6_9CYAN|nr:Rpn family recombination-promoting nuclease/putative transposase [Roseofilum capinflatum]MDJ1175977.1 Rpn family recombination-promoting nuclease/putative transposase [Roseofilum capinflatum BLCC-M114]
MKTDTLFYKVFQDFPEFFFEVCGLPSSTANLYTFSSVEVKQLAFRLDGLFLPSTPNPELPFYLTEVQFQPDETLYYRLFSELFLYLKQYQPPHPWQVVVIYPNRNIERENALHFSTQLLLPQVTRIYLNELPQSSLGLGVLKLIIEKEQTAPQLAKRLIEQTKSQLSAQQVQQNLIDLIETIIVYKLPQKSREEIEAMLGLSDIKQTKVYQEAFTEGEQIGQQEAKLQAIPRMFSYGLPAEAIAELLDLPLETVTETLAHLKQPE